MRDRTFGYINLENEIEHGARSFDDARKSFEFAFMLAAPKDRPGGVVDLVELRRCTWNECVAATELVEDACHAAAALDESGADRHVEDRIQCTSGLMLEHGIERFTEAAPAMLDALARSLGLELNAWIIVTIRRHTFRTTPGYRCSDCRKVLGPEYRHGLACLLCTSVERTPIRIPTVSESYETHVLEADGTQRKVGEHLDDDDPASADPDPG